MAMAPALIATSSRALAGRHIVVTRPQQQAAPLMAAIASAGGVPVAFPLLVIDEVDVPTRRVLQEALTRLAAGAFDLAVFVSPNAVEKTFAELQALGLSWPERLQAAVVGKGSERALAARGVNQVIAPSERFDSEGLLALPALQALQRDGLRVILLRGDGGRELMAQSLRESGAVVECVTCYRRSAPQGAAGDTSALQRLWQQGQLDAITLTSSEGLRHLQALLGAAGRPLLESTPLFVPHFRIVDEAHRLGLSRIVATAAGDAGLLAGLIDFFDSAADPAVSRPNSEMQAHEYGN
jgi:uroporphyrinogen-III synthase